jgi:hypothetical protein
MSENVMTTLITFAGSVIGAIIAAFATIIAAKIQKTGETPKVHTWVRVLVGAVIGGVIVFLFLWLSGMLTSGNDNFNKPVTFINFEKNNDENYWKETGVTKFIRSSEIAFDGKYSLAITTPGIHEGGEFFISWNHPIQANQIIGRVYFPIQTDVTITWMQVCISGIGECNNFPITQGQWHAFSFNLFNQGLKDKYSGFYLQGEIRNKNVEPYMFYIDDVEIYQSVMP